MTLDHVALLVPHIETALERLGELAAEAGAIEEFPNEGTRELYIGGEERLARLLLMQPLGDKGPYARALSKRGPGLHHLGLQTPDLHGFLARLRHWLVHPRALVGWPESRQLWLARPGIGALLEVREGPLLDGEALVSKVEVPITAGLDDALNLGVPALQCSPDQICRLTLGGRQIAIAQLFSPLD